MATVAMGKVGRAAFHTFEANTIAGVKTSMAAFKGKPALIVNCATLWDTTTPDFTAMNAMAAKYGDKLNFLCFFSNQFGHQTNNSNEEMLTMLKMVRPGNNFEPAPQLTLFEKCNVNGGQAHPLFVWLKSCQMSPTGDEEVNASKNNFHIDAEQLVTTRAAFPPCIMWTPIGRSDITWNFEKFLVDADGNFVERFSRYYDMTSIGAKIDPLLK